METFDLRRSDLGFFYRQSERLKIKLGQQGEDRIAIEASSADAGLIEEFIEAGHALVARSVKAITTSCGFLALFQRQSVEALSVPVYTSSLLQVPLAGAVIRRDQKIGIITARNQSLTGVHFAGVDIQDYLLAVMGMEDAVEFSAVFIDAKKI